MISLTLKLVFYKAVLHKRALVRSGNNMLVSKSISDFPMIIGQSLGLSSSLGPSNDDTVSGPPPNNLRPHALMLFLSFLA